MAHTKEKKKEPEKKEKVEHTARRVRSREEENGDRFKFCVNQKN